MKIENTTPKRKALALAAGIVMLLSVGTFIGYSYLSSGSHTTNPQGDDPSLAAPTKDEAKAGSEVKKQTIESRDDGTSTKTDGTSTDRQEQNVKIGISAISQTASILQIRTVINILSNTGQCTLTMTNGETTLTRTAATYASASVSSCRGFDIPLSDLSSGAWDISITVTLNGQTSAIDQKIEVR